VVVLDGAGVVVTVITVATVITALLLIALLAEQDCTGKAKSIADDS